MTPGQSAFSIVAEMLRMNADEAQSRMRLTLMIKSDSNIVGESNMVAPYAYFDESGKFQEQDFICLCGYLSLGKNWDAYVVRWQELLIKTGLPDTHMTNLFHECNKRGLDATRILEQFIDIIRDTVLIGFAVGLDAKYYRSMPPEARHGFRDPAVACLQRLLYLIRERFVSINYRGRIAVTFDEEEASAVKFYETVSRLRRNDAGLGRLISAVCFADDTAILPLQAADILSNLTSKWFKDRMAGRATEKEVPPLLNRMLMSPEGGFGLEYKNELWDAEELRRHLNTFIQWGEESEASKGA